MVPGLNKHSKNKKDVIDYSVDEFSLFISVKKTQRGSFETLSFTKTC